MTEDSFKYLTISNEDKRWGLYLNVAGKAEIKPHKDYPPSGHPNEYFFRWELGRILYEYQLNYITEGEGILETKEKTYTIKPGTLIIIYPGQWHRYKPLKEVGWKEHYVGFFGDFAQHIFEHSDTLPGQPDLIYLGYQENIIDLYLKIIDEVNDERPGFQYVCSGLLVQLIGKVLSIIKNAEFKGKEIDLKIRKARMLLRERSYYQVDMEEFSRELGIGYSYFRRMFKKYTGIAPLQYHIMLRLQRARELLISTNKPHKEIAYELGFQSVYYFSRLFKQKMGITPTQMRNKNKKHIDEFNQD